MPTFPRTQRRREYARALAFCASVVVLYLGSLGVSICGAAGEDQLFVLLRNGEVLRGSLERDGDHYLVRRSGTAELRIPYKDISHAAPNLKSIYEHKANRIIEFDAGENLDLASWCLQNGLEPQATHHILRAETINPLHPHLSLLKARLERFMTHGTRPESYVHDTAVMAVVGSEPIPITAAPIFDAEHAEDTIKQLPVRALQTNSADENTDDIVMSESSTPEGTSDEIADESIGDLASDKSPSGDLQIGSEKQVTVSLVPDLAVPQIDPPELIDDKVAGSHLNGVELPALLPTGAAPPKMPPREINETLIRHVEEKLSSAVQPIELQSAATEPTTAPREFAAHQNGTAAQPLSRPVDRRTSPSRKSLNTATVEAIVEEIVQPNVEPNVDPSAVLDALARQTAILNDQPSVPNDEMRVTTDANQDLPREHRTIAVPGPNLVENTRPADQPIANVAQSAVNALPEPKLSPELIREYVVNIQPILLTRCAAANCHGQGTETAFQLQRVGNQRPSRTMTMQNLAATLDQLNKSDPAKSPLFTWGQTAHGQTQSKLLAISNVQQQTMLLEWIQQATTPYSEAKRPPADAVVDRQRAFADGAERISLRKIKESDIRWQEPTQRAKERRQSPEPKSHVATDIEFSPLPPRNR